MEPRTRRRVLVAGLIVLALVVVDLCRPPADQLTARGLLAAIHLYQATLSPRMPLLGVRCRFQPTCSRYAEGAIRKYGALGGSLRAAWRVSRCGPWTPIGTVDEP